MTVEEAVEAKYKNYEILVDCEKALSFKKKGEPDIRKVLEVADIFEDAGKGLRAAEDNLRRDFGTTDTYEIAKKIIKKGEVQLTAEYREKVRERKRNRVIAKITRQAKDPRTGDPHPRRRIENSIEQAGIDWDFSKGVDELVEHVIEEIRPILPISMGKNKLKILVPAKYTGKAYSVLNSYGKMLQKEWKENGDLAAEVEISPGLEENFKSKLKKFTQGKVQINRK